MKLFVERDIRDKYLQIINYVVLFFSLTLFFDFFTCIAPGSSCEFIFTSNYYLQIIIYIIMIIFLILGIFILVEDFIAEVEEIKLKKESYSKIFDTNSIYNIVLYLILFMLICFFAYWAYCNITNTIVYMILQ